MNTRSEGMPNGPAEGDYEPPCAACAATGGGRCLVCWRRSQLASVAPAAPEVDYELAETAYDAAEDAPGELVDSSGGALEALDGLEDVPEVVAELVPADAPDVLEEPSTALAMASPAQLAVYTADVARAR